MGAQKHQLRFADVADYLAWTQLPTTLRRTELDDGLVVDMAPETLTHVRTKLRLINALARAIEAAGLPCEAVGDGVGVRISDLTLYIPDGLVFCGAPPAGETLIIDHPMIVVEVVSPTSGTRDSAEKMPAYFRVPSIMHYLLVHSGKRFIVHYRRAEENAPLARIHYEGEIVFDPPGIVIAFEQVLPAA